MRSRHEFEVLLRPAVEVHGAIAAAVGAAWLFIAPETIAMPRSGAYAAGTVLASLVIFDIRDIAKVWRYRIGMKGKKPLLMTADELPFDNDKLFIGYGFEWQQKHTQRLADSNDDKYRDFAIKRGMIDHIAEFFTRSRKSIEQLGGNPILHGVELKETAVFIPNGSRRNHVAICGLAGLGKTTDLISIIVQDIRRSPNAPVIVLDPKGSSELFRAMWSEAKACGRLESFKAIQLGNPEVGARYSPIGQFTRLTEVSTRIGDQLPGSDNSDAFVDFAWRYINCVAKGMYELGERFTLQTLKRATEDVDALFVELVKHACKQKAPNLLALYEKILVRQEESSDPTERSAEFLAAFKIATEHGQDLENNVIEDMLAIVRMSPEFWKKRVSSIEPLFEKLTSGLAAELLSPDYFDIDDTRPIITVEQVIRQKSILYIGLDSMTEKLLSAAFGASFLSELTAASGAIYNRTINAGTPGLEAPTPIYVCCDEVEILLNSYFVQLLNKGRGSGIVITAGTQAPVDIEVATGSAAAALQVTDNLGNKMFKRVPSAMASRTITDALPKVRVNVSTAITGATDSNEWIFGDDHFATTNTDRNTSESTPLLSPSEFTQLPIGHHFASVDGGKIFKLRTPLLIDRAGDEEMPADIQGIVKFLEHRNSFGFHATPLEPWWPGSL